MPALPLAIRASVRMLTLTVNGCVAGGQNELGRRPVTIVSAVGRAAGQTLATREASGAARPRSHGCLGLLLLAAPARER